MDLLMRVRRWSFRQACEEVERYLGLEPQGNGRHRPQPVSSGNGSGGKPAHRPPLPPQDSLATAAGPGANPRCRLLTPRRQSWSGVRSPSGATATPAANPLFWIQRLCPGRSGRKAFLHRVWLDGGWHRPSRRDPFSCEWPAPRPLYGLPGLGERPEAPVLVVEGEGTADAAALLFPEHVVISWANGTNAIAKADWQPLAPLAGGAVGDALARCRRAGPQGHGAAGRSVERAGLPCAAGGPAG